MRHWRYSSRLPESEIAIARLIWHVGLFPVARALAVPFYGGRRYDGGRRDPRHVFLGHGELDRPRGCRGKTSIQLPTTITRSTVTQNLRCQIVEQSGF